MLLKSFAIRVSLAATDNDLALALDCVASKISSLRLEKISVGTPLISHNPFFPTISTSYPCLITSSFKNWR